jgi:tetratricopeptide (TPR) repeat protein
MRWLSEYVLKGIFLGLLGFVALQETSWSQVGQVVLFTFLGLAISVAIAAGQKLRQGYKVGGRVPAFILFSLLESSGTVYAGVILGLAIGAFSIRQPESATLFVITFVAGALLGLVFCLLQLVTNRWARIGSSLALAVALIAGAWYALYESSTFLPDQASRNQAAIVLLLGIPFFYLLTFVGSAEESEVEIGAMSAVLGLTIALLAWQERSYQSSGLLLTLILYLWYTTRVLPGLRVFKHVVRGVSHSNIGRVRPALEAFHHALRLDPQNSLARESMARLHRTLDLDQTKHDAQTLALLDFDFCMERVKSLLFDPGPSPEKREEAHHLLDLVLSQRPALRPTVDYWRAVAHTHARQYEEAAANLERILASGVCEHPGSGVITDPARPDDPNRQAILFEAWQLALTLHPELNRRVGTPQLALPGRRLEAIAAVERRLAGLPSDPAGWELKRALYSDLTEADYKSATDSVAADFDHEYVQQLGLALINDSRRWRRGAEYLRIAARGLRSQAPSIFLQIANAHQKAQDAAGVWDNYEVAKQAGRAVGPQNLAEESRKVYFDIVKLLAEDARSRDDVDAAIENYQLLSESDRSGLETLRILAELYEKKGQVFPALFTVEKALLYNPKDSDLLEKKDRYYYSVMLHDLRARKDTIKGFDVAYCLKKARSILDMKEADLDMIDWAQHLIELVRILQPESLTAKVLLARALRRRGEIEQARAILEDIYSHKPEKFASTEEEEAWYLSCRLLGEAYLNEMSRPDLAIPCFTEFRKSSKSGADTLYKLGQAYEQTGDRVRAKKCYEHVTSYDSHPLAPDAREALYRLQSG